MITKFDFTCPACNRTETLFYAINSRVIKTEDHEIKTLYYVRCMVCNRSIVWNEDKHREFIESRSLQEWERMGDKYSDFLLQLKGS